MRLVRKERDNINDTIRSVAIDMLILYVLPRDGDTLADKCSLCNEKVLICDGANGASETTDATSVVSVVDFVADIAIEFVGEVFIV